MKNFELFMPTQVLFGLGEHKRVGEIIRAYGYDNILFLYGGKSVFATGLRNTIAAALRENEIIFMEKGGVMPNPSVEFCREVVEVARANRVQLILAVGGGSVIDTTKMAAHAVGSEADPWEIMLGEKPLTKSLPVGVLLTIAASGSEMSNSAVLTNEAEHKKRGFGCDENRPLFAIMDPSLSYSVPPYQTACGTVDIMMHALERYLDFSKQSNELTDRMTEALLISVINAGRTALVKPDDYEARATLMLAGSWAHNGLLGVGRGYNLTAHKIEHELSAQKFSIAHGAGLAVVWPAYLRYIFEQDLPRFTRLAVEVFNCDMDYANPAATALAGIEATERFFRSMGMPGTLRELGITAKDIPVMAERCIAQNGPLPCYKPLQYADVVEIYKLCL